MRNKINNMNQEKCCYKNDNCPTCIGKHKFNEWNVCDNCQCHLGIDCEDSCSKYSSTLENEVYSPITSPKEEVNGISFIDNCDVNNVNMAEDGTGAMKMINEWGKSLSKEEITANTKEISSGLVNDWESEEWGGWKIISDMLDNPDENGIYSTSEAYKKLYDFVVEQKQKAISSTKKRVAKEIIGEIEKLAYCLLDRDGKFVDFEDIITKIKSKYE